MEVSCNGISGGDRQSSQYQSAVPASATAHLGPPCPGNRASRRRCPRDCVRCVGATVRRGWNHPHRGAPCQPSPTRPSTPAPSIRDALRHPRLRRLLAALAVSQAGDWLYNLALVVLVLDRTHSSVWVAVTTAARVTPMIVGGPFGGVIADRFDRRLLMVVSDGVRAGCMLGLAAVATLHLPSCWRRCWRRWPRLPPRRTRPASPPPHPDWSRPRRCPRPTLRGPRSGRCASSPVLPSERSCSCWDQLAQPSSSTLPRSSSRPCSCSRSRPASCSPWGATGRKQQVCARSWPRPCVRFVSSPSRCGSSAPTSCAAWCTARRRCCSCCSSTRRASATRRTAGCWRPSASAVSLGTALAGPAARTPLAAGATAGGGAVSGPAGDAAGRARPTSSC